MLTDATVGVPAYALFGQSAGLIEPRFCHVERISDRWRLHSGRVERHSHPHLHQLSLWLEGTGQYFANDATSPIRPGTLCWMPSGVIHGFRVEEGADAIVLSMSDDFAREQFMCISSQGRLHLLHEHRVTGLDQTGPQDAWVRQLFSRMEYEYRNQLTGMPHGIGAIARLVLVEMLRIANSPAEQNVGDADAALLLRFMEAVEARLGTRPRIEAIAADLGSTPYLLNRVCRSALGMRASHLVRARHVQEAKRLLLFSSLSVTEIGLLLGYDDPAHFARSFRQATSQSPREWRAERMQGLG